MRINFCSLTLFGILFFLFFEAIAFAQGQNRIICQPSPGKNILPPMIIIDGFPSGSYTLNGLNPATIKTISVQKDTLYDCDYKPVYNGVIIVSTKDSCNSGLKYVQEQTGNWILTHPLAEFKINGRTVLQDPERIKKIFQLNPSRIIKIKITEPEASGNKCKKGSINVKTR
jgi:hypothetical protein